MGSRFRVRGRTLGLVLASFALLASSVSAMGQDASPTLPPAGPDTSIHHVGVTSDPDVYVAVVDRDGFVSIYLCDGADLGVWLQGMATGGAFDLANNAGDTATGTIADGVATGSATLADGTTLTFQAERSVLPAGLFTASRVEDGVLVEARTIVLPDGTAKGLKKKARSCADREKEYEVLMDQFRAATNAADQTLYGNLAHDAFVLGRDNGCAWAASPT